MFQKYLSLYGATTSYLKIQRALNDEPFSALHSEENNRNLPPLSQKKISRFYILGETQMLRNCCAS